MTVIIYTKPEGGVAVVTPIGRLAGEAEGEWLERVAAACVPAGVAWRAVDDAELPADRSAPEVWADDGRAVSVDPERQAALAAAATTAKRKAALAALLTSLDPVAVATRAALTVAFTWINDAREAAGEKRRTEAEIFAAIEQAVAGGDGEPRRGAP